MANYVNELTGSDFWRLFSCLTIKLTMTLSFYYRVIKMLLTPQDSTVSHPHYIKSYCIHSVFFEIFCVSLLEVGKSVQMQMTKKIFISGHIQPTRNPKCRLY